MKTHTYIRITDIRNGFYRAVTVGSSLNFHTAILVALAGDDLENISAVAGKEIDLANGSAENPKAFNTLRWITGLADEQTLGGLPEKLVHLSFAGCLQRHIYLS